jgi:hypothetical protein
MKGKISMPKIEPQAAPAEMEKEILRVYSGLYQTMRVNNIGVEVFTSALMLLLSDMAVQSAETDEQILLNFKTCLEQSRGHLALREKQKATTQ